MPKETTFPVGKLPPDLLSALLQRDPILDPSGLTGTRSRCRLRCLGFGGSTLVLKSDPITFASEEIGWYAVQVNANDIATTGAIPRWMMVTYLLPEDHTTPEMVEGISNQLFTACQNIGVSLIGGHTEITYGLDRPILSATMIGEVERSRLVTPAGVQQGDCHPAYQRRPYRSNCNSGGRVSGPDNQSRSSIFPVYVDELRQARNFLHQPGISVLKDAQIAVQAGRIHAMHDPTEGGLWTALWELAQACGHSLLWIWKGSYSCHFAQDLPNLGHKSTGCHRLRSFADGSRCQRRPDNLCDPGEQRRYIAAKSARFLKATTNRKSGKLPATIKSCFRIRHGTKSPAYTKRNELQLFGVNDSLRRTNKNQIIKKSTEGMKG